MTKNKVFLYIDRLFPIISKKMAKNNVQKGVIPVHPVL